MDIVVDIIRAIAQTYDKRLRAGSKRRALIGALRGISLGALAALLLSLFLKNFPYPISLYSAACLLGALIGTWIGAGKPPPLTPDPTDPPDPANPPDPTNSIDPTNSPTP